jgi:hypothetical protein
VLIPIALIELWRRGGLRAVGRGVAVTIATLAALIVPFAAIGADGLSWALHRQLVRPLQVESLGAVFFAMAHAIGDAHVHVVKSSGSDNLVGGGPAAAATAFGVVTLAALLAVYWLYFRSAGTREQIVVACAAAVTGYVAFSKVFSPQYLVWLIPLVPLVRGRATALLVAAAALTQIWEPWKYSDYYHGFPAGLTTLVLVRDLLVVALFVVLVRRLWSGVWSDRDAEQLDAERSAVV